MGAVIGMELVTCTVADVDELEEALVVVLCWMVNIILQLLKIPNGMMPPAQ